MPKLNYDEAWSEQDEAKIEDRLSLTDEQCKALFEEKGSITITKSQASALKAMNDEEPAEITGAEGGDGDKGGDDDRDTGDTGDGDDDHPDSDVIDVSIAAERDRDAVDIGKAVSDRTQRVFREGYEAREKVNITPLLAMTSLKADMKEKKKDMGDLPIPNSYRKGGVTVIGKGDDAKPVAAGDNARNAPWDRFTYMDVNDNGKQVERKGSYYTKLMQTCALGTELMNEYDVLTAAIASFKKDGPEMPAKYRGKTRPQCVRRRNLMKSRFGFAVTTVKKAVSLDKQCRAFNDLKFVGYSFETEEVEKDGKKIKEYVNRNEPVQVYSIIFEATVNGEKVTYGPNDKVPEGTTLRERGGEPSNLSIGAFLRYDVNEAITKAGGADKVTLEHLQATVKREKKKEGAKPGADDWSKHEIENVRQLENIFSSLTSYLSSKDGDINSKRMAALEKRIDEKDGDEFLIVMGDFSMALDDVWTKFSTRYRQVKDARRKSQKQQAA